MLPLHEHPQALDFIDEASIVAEESIDLDRVMEIASAAGQFPSELHPEPVDFAPNPGQNGLRIGILKDSAFQFYYPENLEALRRRVGPLVEISALDQAEFPEVDGLYIGGGFPETNAERLAENTIFKESLCKAIERGLPVYAECGGLMYLSRNLCVDEQIYPMVGVFPIDTVLERKPQGLGYIRVQVDGTNPFYPQGAVLTGHEFHYSSVRSLDESREPWIVTREQRMTPAFDHDSRSTNHAVTSAALHPPAKPPGTPPAECPLCRSASYASCLPFAFPAICACA